MLVEGQHRANAVALHGAVAFTRPAATLGLNSRRLTQHGAMKVAMNATTGQERKHDES